MAGETTSKKTRAHIRYKNKEGKVVPGATTVIGLLNKPQLVVWANRLGLQGIDSSKFRDEKAEIGTLAHAMILATLKGESIDTSEYSKEQIGQAENSFLSWLEWGKGKDIKPVLLETPLVSEMYQYGGTPDFLGYLNGDIVLMDYKTGGIFREAYIQACSYRHLLYENEYPVTDKAIILGIPRTEDEDFKEVTYTNFDAGWEIFKRLNEVYQLLKEVK